MATITGKTEFARRVKALGLTLVEFEKLAPYTLQALKDVSSGRRGMSAQLNWILTQIEKEHETKEKLK